MQAATINPPPSPLETALRRVRAHLDQGEFAAALGLAEQTRPLARTNRDLLYMIAVSQRYLKRIPDALDTLEELERHHPTYSRLFQ
jgi:hypothetical protein